MLLTLLPVTSNAGTVRTRDGKTYEGPARLEPAQVVVTTPGGEVRIDLEQVKEADFSPPAATAPVEPPDETPAGGLKAEYFQNAEYAGQARVQTDPTVQLAWGERARPARRSQPAGLSARWTGQIKPRFSEQVTFSREGDALLRVWIDNRLVLDYYQQQGSVWLKAGRKYEFRAECMGRRSSGSMSLSWSSTHQRREPLPPSRLYLPPRDPDCPPAVALTSPQVDEVIVMPSPVTLAVTAGTNAGAIAKVEFLDGGKVVGSLEKPPYRFAWPNAGPGTHILAARATTDRGVSATPGDVRLFIAGNGSGTLPSPWGELPIGVAGPTGSARFADGVFTLTQAGAGAGTWGEDGGLRSVVCPLNGDGQIIARIASIESSVPKAGILAGIILRESAEQGSAHAGLLVYSGGNADFVCRGPPPAEFVHLQTPVETSMWLRLTREGATISVARSADGKRWETIGSEAVEMTRSATVALVAGSQDSQATCTARFEQVSVSAGLPPDQSSVTGLMLRNGTVLACSVLSADDSSVRFSRNGKEMTVAELDVSRILYRKVTNDVAATLPPGRSGMLMAKGDFFEGEVRSVSGGTADVRSVLFGIRKFGVPGDTVAIILRDAEPAAADWEVRLEDGSAMRAKSVVADSGRAVIDDAVLGKITVPLAELRLLKGPASGPH